MLKSLEAMYSFQIGGNISTMADMTTYFDETGKKKGYSEYVSNVDGIYRTTSPSSTLNNYDYYPLDALLSQLDCVLQIAQCLLRIERICFIKCLKRSK